MTPARLRWLVEPGSPTLELASLFASAGHSLYLVGGSVRDAFLDREHEDLDFATDARPPRSGLSSPSGPMPSTGSVRPSGPSVFARGEVSLREITTFRSEIYRDDSRKPNVTFSSEIESDLSRRDFTVNAIALRLPDLEAVDPFGGLADLAEGLLADSARSGDLLLRRSAADAPSVPLSGELWVSGSTRPGVGGGPDGGADLDHFGGADPR